MEAIATTALGRIRGLVHDGIAVFRGIPYAAPLVGGERFAPPARPKGWDGIRDATTGGPIAPQYKPPGIHGEVGSPLPAIGSDCLNLNVWTPHPASGGLPVLVWIHGGAFQFGSGSDPQLDGTAFARDGVVTVTFNYRLGLHGFLHIETPSGPVAGSGNFGLLDQVAALEWVQENIAAFGGDPLNVTLAGHSAGAMCVAALLAMERASGLFRRAIAQSGAGHGCLSSQTAGRIAAYVCELLGVQSGLDARDVPIERLLEVERQVTDECRRTLDVERFGDVTSAPLRMPFQPVFGTDVLPNQPIVAIRSGSAANISLMVGTTADEVRPALRLAPDILGSNGGSISDATVDIAALRFFGLADRSGVEALRTYRANREGCTNSEVLEALMTDAIFRIPAIRLADAQSRHATVFAYLFCWRSEAQDGQIGAGHGVDVPFVFDTLDVPSARWRIGDRVPGDLVTRVHGSWTNFICGGDPAHPKLPDWPSYEPPQRTVMVLDEECELVSDPSADERQLWDNVL